MEILQGMDGASGRRATWLAIALLAIGAVVLVVAPLGPATLLVIVVVGVGASVLSGRSPGLRNWVRLTGFFHPEPWSLVVAVLIGVVMGAVISSSAHHSPLGHIGVGVAAGTFVAIAIYSFFVRLGNVSDAMNRRARAQEDALAEGQAPDAS